MRNIIGLLILLLFFAVGGGTAANAKRIKKSLNIEKSQGKASEKEPEIEGLKIEISDSAVLVQGEVGERYEKLRRCSYAGYDKEPSSNVESFILVNAADQHIKGFKVRIDYLDMKGRMFHSRTVTLPGDVPAGESRRFDIAGWDKQHTYYYYLGNQPRRVATPFKVVFTPLAYWVEE